uniref:Type IV pilus assembly protein PilF n=1 Tax=Candidatus Kentrum sp. LFY TaxID=2126342 RepID=A0A450WBR5_9GAMM|nr:MAG: type IV pilus assembly protein PilF [Candidatus Kentron sp. LFY]
MFGRGCSPIMAMLHPGIMTTAEAWKRRSRIDLRSRYQCERSQKTPRFRSRRIETLLLLLLLLPLAGCVTDSGLPNAAHIETQKDHWAELHTQLAIAYLEKGDNDLAWERLERALAIRPNYPDAHNALGSLYQRLNRLEKAEWHYRHAVLLNPSYSDAYNNLGVLLCATGRQTEAEQCFLKAIANPRYREPEIAMSNAGDCAYFVGDLQKAETYLRRALSFNMELPDPLLTMAALSLSKGHPLSARGYLRRYSNVATHTAHSLWLGLRIEKRLGNRDAVSSYALLLRTHHPDSREARLLHEFEVYGKSLPLHDDPPSR